MSVDAVDTSLSGSCCDWYSCSMPILVKGFPYMRNHSKLIDDKLQVGWVIDDTVPRERSGFHLPTRRSSLDNLR